MSNLIIRTVNLQERETWEVLWQAYIKFYESIMSDDKTDLLWQRIHDCEHVFQCRVAEQCDTGAIIGLVHFFPHASTWNIDPVCYLNDLYVSADARGSGAGEALIKAVVVEARKQCWDEVYWLTQHHNTVARGLYDKLTGGSDGFVNYSINTSQT